MHEPSTGTMRSAEVKYAGNTPEQLEITRNINRNRCAHDDCVASYLNDSWSCMVSIYATLLAEDGVFLLINPQLGFILNDSAMPGCG